MNKKSFLLGVLLAVSFSACAADPPRTTKSAAASGDDWQLLLKNASPLKQLSAAECTAPAGGSCVIGITVGDDCKVTPNPEYLKVKPKVFVFWRISPETWSFVPDRGIAFKKAGPFTDSRRLSDQVWRVTVRDVKPADIAYPYAINIRSKDGKTCTIDPAIWV